MGKLIASALLASMLVGVVACGPPYPVPRRPLPAAAQADPAPPPTSPQAEREEPTAQKQTKRTR